MPRPPCGGWTHSQTTRAVVPQTRQLVPLLLVSWLRQDDNASQPFLTAGQSCLTRERGEEREGGRDVPVFATFTTHHAHPCTPHHPRLDLYLYQVLLFSSSGTWRSVHTLVWSVSLSSLPLLRNLDYANSTRCLYLVFVSRLGRFSFSPRLFSPLQTNGSHRAIPGFSRWL